MAAGMQDVRVAQMNSGGPPVIRHFVVAAAEAFKYGSIVRLITDGTIKVAADDDAAVLGVALADAVPAVGPTNIGKEIPVALCTEGVILSIKNSGTAFTVADRDATAALDVAAGPVMTVTVGTAGNALFRLIDADSTNAGWVLVTVPAAKSQAPGWGTAAADAS